MQWARDFRWRVICNDLFQNLVQHHLTTNNILMTENQILSVIQQHTDHSLISKSDCQSIEAGFGKMESDLAMTSTILCTVP